ncbi:exonuclease domain-containing protein, partial [Corynebacterium variabile]|uniref:exonuclease domain-containing protein n=1 Tax=Corynebacterium variabile TaxID=1727 RepID=UPI002648472E
FTVTNQNQGLSFAVVDVETTGFTNRDRVLEVAVVHAAADGTVTGTWSTLVNPDRDIPNTRIHGISAADVVGAPTFADIAGELSDQLNGRIFVAHNVAFDSRLLAAEFGRLGLTDTPFTGASLCTLTLTGRLLPGSGRGLSAALSAAGIVNAHAHAALGDAEATAELLGHYLHRAPETVAQLLQGVHPVTMSRADLAESSGRADAATVPLRTRTTSTTTGDGQWLSQLATGVPVVGQPNVDAYLDLLATAMLDRELSVHEIGELTDCAASLGIGRQEALDLHSGFVRQLAVLAWADGIVTEEEREELHAVARALGVAAADVDMMLDSPVTDNGDRSGGTVGARLRLAPGDRVTFTGETEIPRTVWEARSVDAGLDVGGMTKKSVLLVAADPDSFSSKAKKARKLGVPVISESGFARLLGELENSGSGDVDPRLVVAASHPEVETTGEYVDLPEPVQPVGGGFYDDDDAAPVIEFGDRGITVDADSLGTAFDTAVGLLGFISRTHGSLRAAVEHAGISAVDGELPSYIEALLSQAGDASGMFQLVMSQRRGTVAEVLARFWDSCDDREQRILRDRIVATSPATLDEIGQAIGVTRERVRQLQKKLTERLRPMIIAGPVADLLAGVRAHAYPVGTLEQITAVFPELAAVLSGWDAPLWQILDAFDDDFRIDDGWVCFPDLPTAAQRTGNLLAPMVNDEGVTELSAVLDRSSLDDAATLIQWLSTCGYLVLDDHVLTRVGSNPARAASLLSVVGRPMTVSAMYAGIGNSKSERSFRNGLYNSEELTRVGVEQWALTRWGLPEYTGIADLIGQRVDAAVADGAEGVLLSELVDDLTREFGVAATSVTAYAATGDFTSTGGMVRRRTEPMVNSATPEESNGVYMHDGRWCSLVTVTKDHLRGSGTFIPNGLTATLDLEWNQPRMIPSDQGDQRIIWGNLGNSSVGSIRRFLEPLQVTEGNRIWIDLHDGEWFSVTPARASDVAELDGLDWLADHVGETPGDDDAASYGAVAEALGLAPDAPRRKVLARFRHRSDAEAVEVLERIWM